MQDECANQNWCALFAFLVSISSLPSPSRSPSKCTHRKGKDRKERKREVQGKRKSKNSRNSDSPSHPITQYARQSESDTQLNRQGMCARIGTTETRNHHASIRHQMHTQRQQGNAGQERKGGKEREGVEREEEMKEEDKKKGRRKQRERGSEGDGKSFIMQKTNFGIDSENGSRLTVACPSPRGLRGPTRSHSSQQLAADISCDQDSQAATPWSVECMTPSP